MNRFKLSAVIVAVIALLVILVVGVCLYMYWPAIKGTVDGSKYYTQEDLQNSYNEGYTDGNKSEAELTSKYEYYKKLVDEYYVQIDTLNKEVEKLQALVDRLQASDETNSALIAELNSQISSLNNTIEQLEKSIEYYEDFIADLEVGNQVVATFEYNGSVYHVEVVDKGATLSVTPPADTDYMIFNGWKVNDKFIDLSGYSIQSNTRFVADITYKYKVEFKVDNLVVESQFVLKNEFANSIDQPTKEGFIFDCWTIDGINSVDVNNYEITENTTFLAKFKRVFKVEFIVNNAVYETQSVVEGDCLQQISNPLLGGHLFLGWTINGNDIIENIYDIEIVSNLQYIAKFQISGVKLVTGKVFNTYVSQDVTSIIFDKYTNVNEYLVNGQNVIRNVIPTNVTSPFSEQGRVDLYKVGQTIYVLSTQLILFNEDSSKMFIATNCSSIIFKNINTSYVENMEFMFYNSSKLLTLDLSSFNTSNVTTMKGMFGSCVLLKTLSLTNFDTAKVINMASMFNGCNYLESLDISSFNTSNVEIMGVMFSNCSILQYIYIGSKWNVTNVTDSKNMFPSSSKLPNFDKNVLDKTNAHSGQGGYLTLKEQ